MNTDATLDRIYKLLEEEAQGLYRSLGLLPVSDVDPDMAAASCQMGWGHAEWGLEILAEQQLLEPHQEHGSRIRYRLVPAVRDHARSLAVQHDPEQGRVLVLRRLCEWILANATHVQLRLTPAQATLRRSAMTMAPAGKAPFDDDAEALGWLASYGSSLLDVLGAAEAAGWDDIVWQLVDSFWPLFQRRHPYKLWIAAHEIGLAAARRARNDAAVRQMLASGAIGLSSAGRLDEAITWFGQALDAALRHEDARDAGQALLGLGSCHYSAGRPDQALPFLTQAISRWNECGYPRGVALTTIVLGEIALDHPDRALKLFDRARTMLLDAGDPYNASHALLLQGHTRILTGDRDAGVRNLEDALAALTDVGSTRWRAYGLELLGRAHRDRGEVEAARACFQLAMDLYADISPARAKRTQALADSL
ncbi:tetratricopeptide repeat protein [Streptomyces sp. NPDC002514]|uniref:tetratricopeptide repeat protein n=1 Tax=Streptomyces sp. NPDC001270 TaxID=3364554 RepID=UPI0036C22F8F